jgi:hypothetical protein
VVEFDLTDEQGLLAIREYAKQRPFPKDWSDPEILQRIRDAEGKVQRGVIRRCVDASKARVVIDTDEHRVVCETIDALRADPGLYQRGRALVRVIRTSRTTSRSPPPFRPPARPAPPPRTLRLARCT